LSESRLEEELLYKHVLEEMEAGIIRDGLFAKALATVREMKIKQGLYI